MTTIPRRPHQLRLRSIITAPCGYVAGFEEYTVDPANLRSGLLRLSGESTVPGGEVVLYRAS